MRRFDAHRRRFLDELATVLPADCNNDVTVVFDASVPPGDFPLSSTYRGLRVVFAFGDEDADSRIEYLIAHDSSPKTLTVVSSDRRIRQAASRRRAHPLTADAFWELRDHLRASGGRPAEPEPSAEPDGPIDAGEAAFWVETFRDADDIPGIREVTAPGAAMLTDAEIAEIQRLVDREG